jgi:transposase
MGRSRGGLTTKIHALVDANGLPIRLKLTEGQAHDGRSAADMVDGIGPGQILLADRAYDSDGLREALKERGAWANVKPHAEPEERPGLQPIPLPLPKPGRALLQQAQTFQGRRHSLRKARRQLPRARETGRHQDLDAVYESVT